LFKLLLFVQLQTQIDTLKALKQKALKTKKQK